MIRNAKDGDIPAILEITNEAILNSTAIYEEEPWKLARVQEWYQNKLNEGFPIFVWEESGEVLGFSTYGKFRGRMGYRFTVEHSVYVHKDHRGKEIGVKLMEHLIGSAVQKGYKQMIGVVDEANLKSVDFHLKLGFEKNGHLKKVGFKNGEWLDIVLLQKELKRSPHRISIKNQIFSLSID